MGIASAAIVSLLVIGSLSWGANSLPEGCTKMIGTTDGAIPKEYIVKMKKTTVSVLINIMLELTNSGCEGKTYRMSNTSNPAMGRMTCSNMAYIEGMGMGFAAKMSDAAVMWVSFTTTTATTARPIFGLFAWLVYSTSS